MYYNNKRLLLSVFWVILGAVLLGLSVAEIIDQGIYAGMGGALIAVGILQILRNLRYRNNQEYREMIDIEITDERNKYLRMKAWSIAGYTMVLAGAAGSLVAFFAGHEETQKVLLCSVAFLVFVYWLAYVILNKRC